MEDYRSRCALCIFLTDIYSFEQMNKANITIMGLNGLFFRFPKITNLSLEYKT